MNLQIITGLPRSGSTLLCNILLQNPAFHASATSGLLDILVPIRNGWDHLVCMQAMPAQESEVKKLAVLRAVAQGYYADVDRPVVFDKNRAWPRYLELAEAITGKPAKALVCVRDLREVIASFEMLWRHTSATGQVAQERSSPADFDSLASRCALWARADQPVGAAYNAIKDALARGYRDRLHFVRYEELTARPAQTMAGIYEFLGAEPYEHDFEHVQQTTREDDRVHGFRGLHDIRPAVRPKAPIWPQVLGSVARQFEGQELWS